MKRKSLIVLLAVVMVLTMMPMASYAGTHSMKVLDTETTSYENGAESQSVYSYDAFGNAVKLVYTGRTGIKETTEYEYDKYGFLTKEKYNDGAGYRSEITYDREGNKLTENYHYADRSWEKTVSAYGPYNMQTKQYFSNSEGTEYTLTFEYEYNAKGLPTHGTMSWDLGTVAKMDFQYDGQGNAISAVAKAMVPAFNSVNREETWTYDAKGNMATHKKVSDEENYFQTFKYDAKGNVIHEEYTYDGITEKLDYAYDDEGNMIKEAYSNNDISADRYMSYVSIYDYKTITVNAKSSFNDVADNAYYAEAVEWALQNNVTSGTSATTFAPADSCTRGQVVTFLWRAAGSPEPKTTKNPFKDVKSSDYYYKAVLWAVEKGITSGTTATTFGPKDTCTNAHVLTFLWRSKGQPTQSGYSVLANEYSGKWFSDALAWADAGNIIFNAGELTFNPNASCVRADIVYDLFNSANK